MKIWLYEKKQINLVVYINNGVVAQLVRASVCHTEGRGFKSRLSRFLTNLLLLILIIQNNIYSNI